MKTCTIARLLLLSILFSISAVSNPFEIIRELDIGARASLTYDSNLYGVSDAVYQSAVGSAPSNNEIESKDDFIINFSPSLHFSKKVYLLNISGSAEPEMLSR